MEPGCSALIPSIMSPSEDTGFDNMSAIIDTACFSYHTSALCGTQVHDQERVVSIINFAMLIGS